MSVMNDIRGRWWGAALGGRTLGLRVKKAYWEGLRIWERASPGTYHPMQAAFRRINPAPAADPSVTPGAIVTVDGIRMRLGPQMTMFQMQKLASGRHTQAERELILPLLRAGDTVMELGGGIGMLAIACAREIGGERVHSFEANPLLEPLIRENYALNDVPVALQMCMLGEAHGTRVLHVAEHFSRSSIYKADSNARPYDVPVLPLNDEIARIAPTVLIMDIQGGEGELLGFADLSGVRALLVEMHPDMLGMKRVNELRERIGTYGLREVKRSGQSFLYLRDG